MYPDSYVFPVPVVAGRFGSRLAVYSTILPISSIKKLLRHDPRSGQWKELDPKLAEQYKAVQRRTDRGRIDSLIRYMDSRFVRNDGAAGALPAVSVAFSKANRLERITEMGNGGILHVDAGGDRKGLVIDGLGRISAALELLDDYEKEVRPHEKSLKQARVESLVLAVTIFEPTEGAPELTSTDFQQLFHDFNFMAKPISRKQALSRDHSDVFNTIVRGLAKNDSIAPFGGMSTGDDKPSKNTKPFVSQENLLVFVRGALEGVRAAQNLRLPAERTVMSKHKDRISDLSEFLDAFRETMGDANWSAAESAGLHRTAKAWYALGILYYDSVRLERPSIPDVARTLAKRVPWNNPLDPFWNNLVRPTNNKKVYAFLDTGRTPHHTLVRLLRERLGFDTMLSERGLGD